MSEFARFRSNINEMPNFIEVSGLLTSSINSMVRSRNLSPGETPDDYFQAMWSLLFIERVKGNFSETHSKANQMIKLAEKVGFKMPGDMLIEYLGLKAYSMACMMLRDPSKSSIEYVKDLCDLNSSISMQHGYHSPDIDKAVAMALFAESENELVSEPAREFALSQAKEMMLVLLHTNGDCLNVDEMNKNLPINLAVPCSWVRFVNDVHLAALAVSGASNISIRKH